MEPKSTFYVIIEKIPGDIRYQEFFDYVCDTEQQAWNYAREKARMYGPSARVKSVEFRR